MMQQLQEVDLLGITSAIYMKRANLNVLIISKGYGALKKAEKIENYYGIDKISGKELHDVGIKQVKELGIEIVQDEVIRNL